jgi:hypothetical protein
VPLLGLCGGVAGPIAWKEGMAPATRPGDSGADPVAREGAGEVVRLALTEDQRVAWRKFQKEHQEMPVRVAGCLHRAQGRQSFDDSDWNSEDRWHFAQEGLIYIDGPEAGGEAIWARRDSLGSPYFPAGNADKFEDTEEFRHDQERFDRILQERKRANEYLDEAAERKSHLEYMEEHRARFEKGKLPHALERAKELCPRSEVKAMAVIDLFGGEEPRVLRWYWSDGKETKSSNKPPNSTRQKSLEQFLGCLLRHAGDL